MSELYSEGELKSRAACRTLIRRWMIKSLERKKAESSKKYNPIPEKWSPKTENPVGLDSTMMRCIKASSSTQRFD